MNTDNLSHLIGFEGQLTMWLYSLTKFAYELQIFDRNLKKNKQPEIPFKSLNFNCGLSDENVLLDR